MFRVNFYGDSVTGPIYKTISLLSISEQDIEDFDSESKYWNIFRLCGDVYEIVGYA